MSEVETTPFEDDSSLFLHDLPGEVLLLIFKKCSAKDVGAISQTCSCFRNLVTPDTLWKSLCLKDYNIKMLGNIESYYALYTKLLHRYGWMLGTYHSQIIPYGGLLEIRYQNDEIQGIQMWADSISPTAPLTEHLMFNIKLCDKGPQCVINPNTAHHKSEIIRINETSFKYICNNFSVHIENRSSNDHEGIHEGIIYEKIVVKDFQNIPQNFKLGSGIPCPQIISPGLFTASYGFHGIEIIYFDFQNENTIHGLKITGDPNVYSGKTTIKFDIQNQLTPSFDEQTSLESLKNMNPQTSENLQSLENQKFLIPNFCQVVNDETLIPDRCFARYKGDGQIAFHNYQNPSFSPVHVIIFNNDLFGVIWLDLANFSLYHRIKKSFWM